MSSITNPSLKEFAKEAARIAELRRTINRLSRQLDRERDRQRTLWQAIYTAAHDAASGLEIGPVKPPKPDGRRNPEVAVVLVSDWQLGKRTPTYSTEVCERRIEALARKVRQITEVQRADHPVRELRVYLLGDLVEGELIFPGQAHRIDSSLFRQVVLDGPRILINFLRAMLAAFERVHVVGVIGNHGAIGGRARREMHPESNADMMLYQITKDRLAGEPRISWELPQPKGERAWYAVDKIGNYSFFLAHGDQMRGGTWGIPFYGFDRAISRWASGVIPERFHGAAVGHWHKSASIPFDQRILWVNGSTESGNTWLQEELKAQCPPSQWLLFCHPERGHITAEFRIWL
jgi:hypothetical protein